MADPKNNDCGCGPPDIKPLPVFQAAQDEPCCGPPAAPPSSPFARPGYELCGFVADFMDTEVGPVPRVRTGLSLADHAGTVRTRLNIGRHDYRVAPGLYCTGSPHPESPVLVTANYKLSFDSLRRQLAGLDAWLLVLDTRGVNVWCAAGKGTLSTGELVKRIQAAGLARLVSHRKIILPQLAATGVSGQQVLKSCGFRVIWGPVRAADLPRFLATGMQADAAMRLVTFTLWERLVLIPVELSLVIRPSLWILAAVFLLSGIGPDIFSIGAAWQRGILGGSAYLAGLVAGAVAVPLLLPWLPGKSFSLKGLLTGLLAGVLTALVSWDSIALYEAGAVLVYAAVISSYVAMNFTGATPFTSPSGVEKEMRRAIPFQAGGLLAAVLLWLASAFTP